MKTSLAEIVRIEKFLAGQLDGADRLLFEGRLIIDKQLQKDVVLHRVVRRLVRLYYRKKIKGEVARAHARLFGDPAKARFRESVLQHFSS